MLLPIDAPKLRLGIMEPAMLADWLLRIRAALDWRAASRLWNAGLSMDFCCSSKSKFLLTSITCAQVPAETSLCLWQLQETTLGAQIQDADAWGRQAEALIKAAH